MTCDVRNDYKKVIEILDVLDLLSRPNGATFDEISAHIMRRNDVAPSRRTIERILRFVKNTWGNHFDDSCIDYESNKRRYQMVNWYGFLPVGDIKQEEMQALRAAIKKTTNTPIKNLLESLERRLQEKLAHNRKMAGLDKSLQIETSVHGPQPTIMHRPEIVDALRDAALNQHQVEIEYARGNGITKYIVGPLGFIYGNTNNYLVAYDAKKNNQTKNFILADIRRVIPTNRHFAKPRDFSIAQYAQRSFGLYHSAHGPYDVEWHVAPDAADAARRFTFHPTQTITDNDDGSITIKFKADGLGEMAMYLFQWGGKITPIAPDELRDTYADMLARCSASLK